MKGGFQNYYTYCTEGLRHMELHHFQFHVSVHPVEVTLTKTREIQGGELKPRQLKLGVLQCAIEC